VLWPLELPCDRSFAEPFLCWFSELVLGRPPTSGDEGVRDVRLRERVRERRLLQLVKKGIRAYGDGCLARPLVDYLLSDPASQCARRYPPNPATGKPCVDIRKQWDRRIAIASDMLGYPLGDTRAWNVWNVLLIVVTSRWGRRGLSSAWRASGRRWRWRRSGCLPRQRRWRRRRVRRGERASSRGRASMGIRG
jgi:hypothetical protein